MNKELSSIAEQLFGGIGEPIQNTIWHPHADIYRNTQGWLIKLELAGVGLEAIQVNFSGANLKIEGMRRDFIANEVKQAYKMEISYNRFERVIELPEKFRDAQVSVDFSQGMLMIYVQEGNNADE